MDVDPPPGDVPDELVEIIKQSRAELCEQWDRMYPLNPVEQEVDDD